MTSNKIFLFIYQKVKTLDVIVEARDHGTPSLSSTAVVTINVVDTNTHPPVFKSNKARVIVTSLLPSFLLTVVV